jgi:hypothetical protein
LIIRTKQLFLLKLPKIHLTMKRIISLLAFAVISIAGASAQNNYCAVAGTYHDAEGKIAISDPKTTLQVQLTVTQEQTIVGPYAKYAQKFLGVRPALVERTSYNVTNAIIALAPEQATALPADGSTSKAETYLGSLDEFAKITPDRLSSSMISVEDAAQQAAQMIFSIRKHRMELITGEAGENVFGGGLKDALDALDEKEQELLELFLGKKISTTSTHSYTIPLANGVTEYTVAKFAAQSGLKPASAADGDVVKLTLTPGAEPKFSSLQEVEASNKAAIAVRIANFATCSVAAGNKMIGTNTLPVFELGRTAYILGSAKK